MPIDIVKTPCYYISTYRLAGRTGNLEGKWHLNKSNRRRKRQKENVMTSLMTNEKKGELVGTIQISEGVVFEPWRWREAILAYLDGVWGKDFKKDYPPNLTLNYHWLR